MPENEPKIEPEDSNGPNNYLKFTGLAFQMIAIIGVFTYIGYRIDKAENHQTQWVTAMFSLIGVFISFYTVFKSLKN
ncbi:AtpZ/AtpI family protein [Mucilaginibacter sp.]